MSLLWYDTHTYDPAEGAQVQLLEETKKEKITFCLVFDLFCCYCGFAGRSLKANSAVLQAK